MIIHCVSKNVPPLTCCNLNVHDPIMTIFGRSVTKKVRNQIMLCFPTSPIYWFSTTLRNGETRKSHFFTQMLYQCIATIQLVAPWFLQSFLFWLMTGTHADVWLPKSCNQCVQVGAVGGGTVQEKGSRERRKSWTVLHTQCMCTNALFSWKKKNVICDVFDSVWHLLT